MTAAAVRLLLVALCLPLAGEANVTPEPPPLKVVVMVSGGEQREVYMELLRRFEAEHPAIDVQHREYEQETYKANLEQWLNGDEPVPDVMFWFAGHLMEDFYRKGLIRPIEDLWQAENWDEAFSEGMRDIVSYRGQAMGLPIAYYHWGIYYHKPLFEELGVLPPATWDELIRVGEVLNRKGITPFALGTRAHWPAAAWFDYLNLRLNGLRFHSRLMAGEISYQHPDVRRVFEHWQQLVDRDFFMEGHTDRSWRAALPFFYQKHAAMMLIGGFVKPQLPDTLKDAIGVIRFPVINPDQPVYENAPTDIFFVPSEATNVDAARQLLSFMARADTQSWFNERLGTTPPRLGAKASPDALSQSGLAVLQQADGFSQFFDRDTPRGLSSPAMVIFVDFMNGHLTIDEALLALEQARQAVF